MSTAITITSFRVNARRNGLVEQRTEALVCVSVDGKRVATKWLRMFDQLVVNEGTEKLGEAYPHVDIGDGAEPKSLAEANGRWVRVEVKDLTVGREVYTQYGARTIASIEHDVESGSTKRLLRFVEGESSVYRSDTKVLAQAEPEPEPERTDGDDLEAEPDMIAGGGWCAPSDSTYSFLPEATVTRGGISFTDPFGHLSREQLIDQLRLAERRVLRLESKVRRLKEIRRRLRRLLESAAR